MLIHIPKMSLSVYTCSLSVIIVPYIFFIFRNISLHIPYISLTSSLLFYQHSVYFVIFPYVFPIFMRFHTYSVMSLCLHTNSTARICTIKSRMGSTHVPPTNNSAVQLTKTAGSPSPTTTNKVAPSTAGTTFRTATNRRYYFSTSRKLLVL